MDRQTIAAGWLTLRPFTPADIPWVYEVSLDPVLQRFMQVPSPYRLEDAASHVEQVYIAGWEGGRRAEFLAEDAATATPLGRVGLRLGEPGAAEVGYWVDPRARKLDSSSRRRCVSGVSATAFGWTSGSVHCSATR